MIPSDIETLSSCEVGKAVSIVIRLEKHEYVGPHDCQKCWFNQAENLGCGTFDCEGGYFVEVPNDQ